MTFQWHVRIMKSILLDNEKSLFEINIRAQAYPFNKSTLARKFDSWDHESNFIKILIVPNLHFFVSLNAFYKGRGINTV